MARLSTVLIPATALALVLTVTGCDTVIPVMSTPSPSPSYAATGDGVLRIGTILPASAAAQVAAVEVAVREINESGGVNGVPVEVYHRTSGDEATPTAEAALASLVAKGVDVVIGPSTSELVERLARPAASANVALISPSAVALERTDDSRSVVSMATGTAAHAAAMAEALVSAESTTVAYLATDDEFAANEGAALAAALESVDGELTLERAFDAAETDFTSITSAVTREKPDAVVVSTATAEQAIALLSALGADGFAAERIWLAPRSTLDYAPFLAAGVLDGATGITGVPLPDAFATRLRQADPSLTSLAYAAEAYDATVLAALAVVLGGDDGGPAISRTLRSASAGGIPCGSVGECLSVLATESDIDYSGPVAPADLSEAGDATRASFTIVTYGEANSYTADRVVVAG